MNHFKNSFKAKERHNFWLGEEYELQLNVGKLTEPMTLPPRQPRSVFAGE